MPDANGFWTAGEQQAYRNAGDQGDAPGTTDEQRQQQRAQTYGDLTYTDPTGRAVRGWEGSWQADPLAGAAGGALWMPGEAGRDWGAGSASRANPAGMSTFLRDIAPDTFGTGTNILNTMQGRGLYGAPGADGSQYLGGPVRALPTLQGADPLSQTRYITDLLSRFSQPKDMSQSPNTTMNLPARSRQAAANPGGQITAINPGGQQVTPSANTQGNPFQAFMNWFSGGQKWEPGAAMMDFTGRAPFNPTTGQNLGGPTDLGAFYGAQGVQPPVVGRHGQTFLPGYQNLGTSYNTNLMQNNPGLFMAELQQQQMQNPRQTVSGTPSPWLPPQLTGGQPAQNPAMAAYAQQGLHQGPGAFGPGGLGPNPAGPTLGPAQLGPGQGPGGPIGPQTGQPVNPQVAQLLASLFGGGGENLMNPLAGGGGNLAGVAQLLAFIQSLRGQFGGVGGFQQRPPAFGGNGIFRGGSSYLYPSGYGPR